MTPRTITSYPELSSLDDSSVFLAVGERADGKYGTAKVSYGTIKQTTIDAAYDKVRSDLSIPEYVSDFGSQVLQPIYDLSSGDVTLSGGKAFDTTPTVPGQELSDVGPDGLMTLNAVESFVGDHSGSIGTATGVDFAPHNDQGSTDGYGSTAMMKWYIGDGQTVSEATARCTHAGNLVVYGWLADRGNPDPQTCWVGLFGKIANAGEATPQWTALQVQPWIVGKNSSVFQYVSFNVPVNEGLEIKIQTGFPVNGSTTGLGGKNGLLPTAPDAASINEIVGYIVH